MSTYFTYCVPCVWQIDMASCYDYMTSWLHDAKCSKRVSSIRSAKNPFSSVSPILRVDSCNSIKLTLVTCTVDLTNILIIPISVIRCPRKMIFLVSYVYLGEQVQWNQNNKLCHIHRATVNLVGQGRLTTILIISISAIVLEGCLQSQRCTWQS